MVLVIKKEPGYTSHQVVAKLRRLLGEDRIGHTGTLDPMASGVLVTAVGQATRVIPYLDEERKVYRGRLVLGVATDTQDITGRIISVAREIRVSREELAAVFQRKTGRQEQLPPMYSAVKVEGEPLYKQARRGRELPREKRKIHIYRLEFAGPVAPVYGFTEGPEFLVECSKGTYVRTLCHDIGQELGAAGAWGNWNAWPPALHHKGCLVPGGDCHCGGGGDGGGEDHPTPASPGAPAAVGTGCRAAIRVGHGNMIPANPERDIEQGDDRRRCRRWPTGGNPETH